MERQCADGTDPIEVLGIADSDRRTGKDRVAELPGRMPSDRLARNAAALFDIYRVKEIKFMLAGGSDSKAVGNSVGSVGSQK